MSVFLGRSFFVLALLFAACTPTSQSELSKALEAAVKDKKVSSKKMESIIQEYTILQKEDKKKAAKYVVGLLNAMKMGGDSSHIDVVRRQFLARNKKVQS